MKKFENLPKHEQTKFKVKFINLDKVCAVEDTPTYTYLAVSVFDHWLTRDEFYSYLGNVSDEEQKLRSAALYSFSKKVINGTRAVNFKWAGFKNKQEPKFRRFTSEKSKLEYFLPAVDYSNKALFLSVLPDLDIIFLGSRDDTNVMYLKDISVKPQIEKWAAESGVYCLDKWT
jgi:hypothetical protein